MTNFLNKICLINIQIISFCWNKTLKFNETLGLVIPDPVLHIPKNLVSNLFKQRNKKINYVFGKILFCILTHSTRLNTLDVPSVVQPINKVHPFATFFKIVIIAWLHFSFKFTWAPCWCALPTSDDELIHRWKKWIDFYEN